MALENVRAKINEVDDKILDLFLERIALSEQVAECKKDSGLPIVNREREREVLRRMMEKAGDKDEYAFQLFTKLMDLSKARQRELYAGDTKVRALVEGALLPAEELFPKKGSVAVQGIEGANAQVACDKLLPMGNILYVKTFEAVFNAVESGFCEYGVLPIENNTNGSVRAVYELLLRKNFSIVRSTSLHIRHELMVKPGTKLEDITEIYSHEQAIGQCGEFLTSLGSGVKVVPCANTAIAAKMVSECPDGHMASISNPACAELYGLEVLRDDIQNNANNYTKFILIKKKPAIYAGADRISIVLACPNRPGALGDILALFSSRGINMVKLESVPVTGRNFEFIFYIELTGSVRDAGVLPILEELERTCESFTFLGNYQML